MSDNIVYLKNHRQRLDPEERRALIQNLERSKLSEIEKNDGTKGPVFSKFDDRVIAAQENGKLIARARKAGISVKEIKKSFENYDHYSLNTDYNSTTLDNEEAVRKRLIQKVRGYLELTKIVAELLGEDVVEAKLDVLRNTHFWSVLDKSHDDEGDERASHLARELNQLGNRVIRRTGLEDFFKQASRVPGEWDRSKGCYVANRVIGLVDSFNSSLTPEQVNKEIGRNVANSPNAVFSHQAYENTELWRDETNPLPAVPLARLFHAELKTRVILFVDDKASQVEDRGQSPELASGTEVEATLKLYRQVGLCLGPTRADDQIGAMFESRAHLDVMFELDGEEFYGEIASQDGDAIDFYPFMADTNYPDFEILAEGQRFQMRPVNPEFSDEAADESYDELLTGSLAEHPLWWHAFPLLNEESYTETHSLSWMPVNAEYVSYWLDSDKDDRRAYCVVPEPEKEISTDHLVFWYVFKNIAYEVETAIANGAIEKALVSQIEIFRNAIDQREKEWRQAAKLKTEELLVRWSEENDDQC